jgi:hypothetical protein
MGGSGIGWVAGRQRWLRVVTEPGWRDRPQRLLGPEFRTMNVEPTIRYYAETDTMAIELRPWPGRRDG